MCDLKSLYKLTKNCYMRHKLLTNDITRLIFVSIVAVVLIGGYIFAWEHIKSIKHDSGLALAQAETELASFFESGAVQREFDSVRLERLRLTDYILDTDSSVRVFDLLDEYARETNVELDIISAETNGDLRIELEAEGPFENVIQFARVLETVPLYISIPRMEISELNRISTPTADGAEIPTEPNWQVITTVHIKSFTSEDA